MTIRLRGRPAGARLAAADGVVPRAALGAGAALEALEDRRLLAGVTIVVHGHTDNADEWVAAMGDAVAAAAVAPGGSVSEVPQYRVDATQPGGIGTPITVSPYVRTSGPADWGRTGEVVVKLDWGAIATGYASSTPAGDVADAFAAYLLNTPFDGHRIAELPVHLLGHSRGGSLITRLAQRLGEKGVWVDHFTSLDPHPVDGVGGDDLADFGDDPMRAWENVTFADTYYRQDGFNFLQLGDVDGEAVAGAYNLRLQDSVLEAGGYGYGGAAPSHNSVHLWYHGTIGPQAAPLPLYPGGDGSATVGPTWYASPHPARDASGFKYSLIEGGDRPAAGLWAAYGGAGARLAVTRDAAGSQWPNVGRVRLRNLSATVSVGQRVFFSYRFQDYDGASSVTWYADADTNPYNANATPLGTAQALGPTGSAVARGQFHAGTGGLAPGTVFVYARIADADGHVRYAYSPDRLTLVASPAVPSLAPGQTIARTLGDDFDVQTFRASAGERLFLALERAAGSPVDPAFDVYGPTGALLASRGGVPTASWDGQTAPATGTYYVVARDDAFDEAGGYLLAYHRLPGANAPDPDGDPATLSAGQTVPAAVQHPGDLDVFAFSATAGDRVGLAMASTSSIDPAFDVYGPGGQLITGATGSPAVLSDYPLPATGIYYVVASDAGRDEAGAYTLGLSGAPHPAPFVGVDGGVTYDRGAPALEVRFSTAAGSGLAPSAIVVRQLPSNAAFPAADVSFDPLSNLATFFFAPMLPDGNYRATIAAGSLTDAAGSPLATEFTYDFFILAGDVDRDRAVGFSDLLLVAQNYDRAGMGYGQGDLDGDGTVGFADLLLVAQKYDVSLPAPAAAVVLAEEAPLAVSLSAPSRAVSAVRQASPGRPVRGAPGERPPARPPSAPPVFSARRVRRAADATVWAPPALADDRRPGRVLIPRPPFRPVEGACGSAASRATWSCSGGSAC